MLSEKCENVILMFGGRGVKEIREVDQRLTDLGEDAQFVIIATGKYVGEGFDFPRLDTLFLALPISWKGKVTQYTGRLHRLYSGKEDVIVYDYVDVNIPLLESTYFKRIKAYKAVGYKTITNKQDDDNYNFIYSVDEFIRGFNADCGKAKREIVISSPNITMRRVAAIIPVLSAKLIDDAVITVFTKPLDENKESARDGVSKCIERLDKTGINIVHRKNLYHRFAIIDQRIVWYGSINPIGYSEADDGMMRIDDADVAFSLLESLAVVDSEN
jgi:superfamily II DNA or RNA helicase